MLFLLLAAAVQTVPPPEDDDPLTISPGRCIAAADRLDSAVRMAREMLDARAGATGDTTQTQARIARAEAVSRTIRQRFPKVVATDDDSDDVAGGDVMPFAETCLTADLPKPAK